MEVSLFLEVVGQSIANYKEIFFFFLMLAVFCVAMFIPSSATQNIPNL